MVRYVIQVFHNFIDLVIRKDERKRHRVVVDLPGCRLGEFPVDYSEEIEVLVDENILRSHVHVIEMKWAVFNSFKNRSILHNVLKYVRA